MNWSLFLIGARARLMDAQVGFVSGLKKSASILVRPDDCPSDSSIKRLEVRDPDKILDGAIIHRLAEQEGLDVLIANRKLTKCKALFADMEATVILDEMLDLLAEERGIGAAVARITARAMAGELDFSQSLIERTRLLAGTPESQLVELCRRIRYTPGAHSLVQTMRASGAKTVLVTGGYQVFAEEVARLLGFDRVVANHPIIRDGIMTGELRDPICTAETKHAALLRCCNDFDIDPALACCIGDGANDVLMLKNCGLSVSFKGKPVVLDIVDLNITSGDLEAVLYAQGFLPSEVVRPG